MSISIDHLSSLVMIAGISGAGRSTALHALADLGFSIIENLPSEMLHHFIDLSKRVPERYRRTAIILETETPQKVQDYMDLLKSLEVGSCKLKVIFLDASTETLLRRYSSTRRPHPGFDQKKDRSLEDTIERERTVFDPIRQRANLIFDTSTLSVQDLRRELRSFVDQLDVAPSNHLRVNVTSFGFKYGVPRDCDLIVDVRFLPNPYFIESLRYHIGTEPEVSSYVLETQDAQEFLTKYLDLLNFLLPKYAHEGKAYLNIGIGCTGGKHRSVAIAEELFKRLSALDKYMVSVKHRDTSIPLE